MGTQAHTARCMMATRIVCWQNHFTSQLREPESGALCSVVKHPLWGWKSPFAMVSGVHWNDRKPHPGHSLFLLTTYVEKTGFLLSCFPYICCWEELGPQPATAPQEPLTRDTMAISMHSASGCVTAGGQIPTWGIIKQGGDFQLKDTSHGSLKCSHATEAASEIPISPFFRTIISFIFPQTDPQTFFSSPLRFLFERTNAIDHAGLLPR